MEAAVLPSDQLIALMEPYDPYTSKKGGRHPFPLATMQPIHL
jgi:hypothetical protein